MQLNPNTCQILFAHLQPALVEQSATEHPDVIVACAGALGEMASKLAIPMTFGVVPQSDGNIDPIEPLQCFVDDGNSFAWSAATVFVDPRLVGRLAEQERPTLLIGGFATEVAVLHSALDALAAGYSVYVAVDAIGGLSPRTEHAALDEITAAGGTITSTPGLLSMLAPDFSCQPGLTALDLVLRVGKVRSQTLSRKHPHD